MSLITLPDPLPHDDNSVTLITNNQTYSNYSLQLYCLCVLVIVLFACWSSSRLEDPQQCKVATLTQFKVIYFQPNFHMCISVSQPVRNIGIAVFTGKSSIRSPSTFKRLVGERSVPSVGKWIENFILPCTPPNRVYIYVCVCVCAISNTVSAQKILRTRLKNGNGRLGNALEVAETTTDSKSKGKNTGYTRNLHGQ